MAVSANELGRHSEPSKSPSVRVTLFPKFRSFIADGKFMGDEVVDLLTGEEIIWLREARTSSLQGKEVSPPESTNRFPHLAGFSLTEGA
jgi:hypothetical protein